MKVMAFFLMSVFSVLSVSANENDTTDCKHWSAGLTVQPGWVIGADQYVRKWLRGNFAIAFDAAVRYAVLPGDSDAYAKDFGYPALSVGLKYALNHGVTMRREKDAAWGLLQPVDYTSRLGNTVTVYAMFERAILRTPHWQIDYTLATGVGYTKSKYNTYNAIDNEFIGSRWLIYFGAGAHAIYYLDRAWGVRAGVDFYHHSNGAMNRPNKGVNVLGPSVGVVYEPYHDELARSGKPCARQPFTPFSFMDFAFSVGVKTLHEDWQLTQFRTPPGAPNYRTPNFKVYPTYSLQTSFMRRYARRWASGIGVDVFLVSYANRVRQLDERDGLRLKHSPWSMGVSGKHRVYYHNLSLDMSLGYYLFRALGDNANKVETPYYEQIGVHYTFTKLKCLNIGINIKAHKTKADYTELAISMPMRL